jgi:translation initiation factor IF-2
MLTDTVCLVSLAGTISTLKRVKLDVNEVGKGTECGIQIEGFEDIQEGDIIQVRFPLILNLSPPGYALLTWVLSATGM